MRCGAVPAGTVWGSRTAIGCRPVNHCATNRVTDLLTESFCERCGTRYALGQPPKSPRLSKIKVLSRGLKGYVMSDQASLTDALGEARSETERQAVQPPARVVPEHVQFLP